MILVRAVPSPGGGTVYQVLLLFHVLCVTGGFGALIYRSYILDNARRPRLRRRRRRLGKFRPSRPDR